MAKVEEFWIITWGGITLFYYSPKKRIESSLIPNFLSCIQSVAGEIMEEPTKSLLKSISIGNYKYNFLSHSKYKLYFIFKSLNSLKAKEVQHNLNKISEMFIQRFKSDLINFEGEITIFYDFKTEFEDYFKKYFIEGFKDMWL